MGGVIDLWRRRRLSLEYNARTDRVWAVLSPSPAGETEGHCLATGIKVYVLKSSGILSHFLIQPVVPAVRDARKVLQAHLGEDVLRSLERVVADAAVYKGQTQRYMEQRVSVPANH